MTGPADPLLTLAGLEGVGSAVTAARDAVDAVLRDRGRRAVTPEQTREALVVAARATAALESAADSDPDHDQQSAGPGRSADDHGPAGRPSARWEGPAIRMYTELIELAGLIRVAPGQAIARAHTLLARGLVADDDLGRVLPGEGGRRLAGLQRLLAGRSEAPVIVIAGIAHAELITIAPFVAGNGIVARAVEHMILIAGDIDAPAVTVPEAGHRALAVGYRRSLDGYRSGSTTGVRDWLLYVAQAVTKGAELSPLKPARLSRPAGPSGPTG